MIYAILAQTEPIKQGMIDAILSNPIAALFSIIGLGMLLGSVRIKGVSLGSSGVLFSALLFGHLGYTVPGIVGTIGLVLFVYGIGIAAGPSFFRAFVKQGASLAKLSVALVAIGAAVTVIFAKVMDVPADLAVGIFAGSMTSTPALAAAMDQLRGESSMVSIGYGVAYPIGVVGVVLFVQLLPRLLKQDLDQLGAEVDASRNRARMIMRVVVEVTNPTVAGRPIVDVDFFQHSGCQVVRVMDGHRMIPLSPDLTLEVGQRLLVVGKGDALGAVVDFLGKRSDEPFFMDAEGERKQVVVTSPRVAGRALRELHLLRRFGVTVSRIARNNVNFVPNADTVIDTFDVLTVVGEPESLAKFADEAGHRTRAIDETDLVSLAIGITAGVVLGKMPFRVGEGGEAFTLGMAGGPLLVALVLGHFGHIGRVTGHVPRAARILMTELGLTFFLAGAGVAAGGSLVDVLKEHGIILLFMGIAITVIPMAFGYVIARKWLGMNLLELLGGVCGGMTSTPGLGAITARTDCDVPVISYATAYPVALIFMTACAQIVISLLR